MSRITATSIVAMTTGTMMIVITSMTSIAAILMALSRANSPVPAAGGAGSARFSPSE
jgi:hypothetical protein